MDKTQILWLSIFTDFTHKKVSIHDTKIATEATKSRMIQNNLFKIFVPVSSNSDKVFTQICILLICATKC